MADQQIYRARRAGPLDSEKSETYRRSSPLFVEKASLGALYSRWNDWFLMPGVKKRVPDSAWYLVVTIGLLFMQGLVSCATSADAKKTGEVPGVFRFRSTDGAEMIKDLEHLFTSNGFVVLKRAKKLLKVRHDGKIYLVRPDLRGPGEIDRLIVTTFWRVRPEVKKTSRLAKFVWDLNNKFNAAQFSLDRDQDLMILSQITFVDSLDIKEFEYFANWMNKFLKTQLKRFPNVRSFLK